MVTLTQTIPALPVRDAAAAVEFYRDRLGFDVLHHDGGFAVLARDEAVLHLWEAGDESWRERESIERPVRSGAESFIAGHGELPDRVEPAWTSCTSSSPGRRAPPGLEGRRQRHGLRRARVRDRRPRRQPRHLLPAGMTQ